MKYEQLVRVLVIRRHALGLRQADVAELMGVGTPQHLGRLEGLEVIAKSSTLERWTEALGLHLHYEVKVRKRLGRPPTDG